MARPQKEVNEDQVRKLAGMGLSLAEIAAVCDCSHDTIERRFASALKGGRERLCASLKRKQFAAAMKGNVTMLIWLGKQYLGQSDKIETKSELSLADIANDLDSKADGYTPEEPPDGRLPAQY